MPPNTNSHSPLRKGFFCCGIPSPLTICTASGFVTTSGGLCSGHTSNKLKRTHSKDRQATTFFFRPGAPHPYAVYFMHCFVDLPSLHRQHLTSLYDGPLPGQLPAEELSETPEKDTAHTRHCTTLVRCRSTEEPLNPSLVRSAHEKKRGDLTRRLPVCSDWCTHAPCAFAPLLRKMVRRNKLPEEKVVRGQGVLEDTVTIVSPGCRRALEEDLSGGQGQNQQQTTRLKNDRT